MAKQRTVRTAKFGERVTVQADDDGSDYFYVEVCDGVRNAWTFTTRRRLEQVRDAINAVLRGGKRKRHRTAAGREQE